MNTAIFIGIAFCFVTLYAKILTADLAGREYNRRIINIEKMLDNPSQMDSNYIQATLKHLKENTTSPDRLRRIQKAQDRFNNLLEILGSNPPVLSPAVASAIIQKDEEESDQEAAVPVTTADLPMTSPSYPSSEQTDIKISNVDTKHSIEKATQPSPSLTIGKEDSKNQSSSAKAQQITESATSSSYSPTKSTIPGQMLPRLKPRYNPEESAEGASVMAQERIAQPALSHNNDINELNNVIIQAKNFSRQEPTVATFVSAAALGNSNLIPILERLKQTKRKNSLVVILTKSANTVTKDKENEQTRVRELKNVTKAIIDVATKLVAELASSRSVQ